MPNLWPVPIYLGVALVLIVLYAVGPRLVRGSLLARRSFWCPFRAVNVQAEFKESAWDGSRLDVQGCSAFAPPTAIGCDKACLDLRKLPGAKPLPPAVAARDWAS